MSSKGENEHSDAGEDEVLEAVGALAEPVRRRLYRYVVATPDAIGRDAAAEAAGISRSLAAFHLDKLVEAGLLAVTYRRLSGRAGPGAGRPSKLYLRAPGERAVSLPPRSYGSAGGCSPRWSTVPGWTASCSRLRGRPAPRRFRSTGTVPSRWRAIPWRCCARAVTSPTWTGRPSA